MKIVMISSLDCPSCIIMNNVLNKITEKYVIDIDEYDCNFDNVEKYNPGKIMPILIFTRNDVEVYRLCGEHDYEEVLNIVEGGWRDA
jgi:predicted secreted Zn-dependent protease